MYAKRLERLGIETLGDLLYHIPSRYEDYSIISKIDALQPGETVTIQGQVLNIQNIYTRRFRTIQKAEISDDTGTIEVTWFNQPFLLKNIHPQDRLSISGKVERFGHKFTIKPAEYEIIGNDQTIHTGRLVPIYPQTWGVSSKWLRNHIAQILKDSSQIKEFMPESILEENQLLEFDKALYSIHFPKSSEDAKLAKIRLAFDELFFIQLAGLKRKEDWKKNMAGFPFQIAKFKDKISAFWENLPFELTNAQKKAVREIFADLASKEPMNRLLEGDVGSGKTVVAAISMYLSCLNNFQSVIMAPTEILAQQHYNTISNLLSPFKVKVVLVTGSKKWNKKNEEWEILVGTHAVLSEKINFGRLGLVVIDEQQRFGVQQRATIRKRGKNPHLLTMTATPIPRTVALTMYGDLDLSFLDEMPIGRKQVKTWLVSPQKRTAGYEWIKSQIKEHQTQAFIICPFIEESESLISVKAAVKEYDTLQKEVFKNFKLGLLHGRLKAKEKNTELDKFRNGQIDILVATPVVEVGIDIQNATVMIIEGAERFGLAQLHQLRGRVGRGDQQSYCLLFTQSESEYTLKRLKAMESMHVGAQLAELDLKLRGPGEIYGTRQHGVQNLKAASFSDFPLIEKTRKEAEKNFPKLQSFPLLQERLKSLTIQAVSPD